MMVVFVLAADAFMDALESHALRWRPAPEQRTAWSAILFEGRAQSFRTANGRNVVALDGLSFAIEDGTRAAIVGPSGCGESRPAST